MTRLIPITSREETEAAFEELQACLTAGSKEFIRTVEYPGGKCELNWHEEERFWVLFGGLTGGNYRWWGYGTMDPNLYQTESLSITVEINPPAEGINRRQAGVFLRDANNGLYLAHSGKLGGNRKGIGKAKFLENYTGTLQEITWPDGVTKERIVLGKVGEKSFLINLGTFIHAVDSFKRHPLGKTPR